MIPVVVRHLAEGDVENALEPGTRGKMSNAGLSSSRSFRALSSASRRFLTSFPKSPGMSGGCLALQKLAAALVSALEPIGSDPAAAEIRTIWSKGHRD